MDLSALMTMLPMLIAAVTPVIVSLIKNLVGQMSLKIPKAFIPIIAGIVGAIAEGVTTGTVTQAGPLAGLAATGVRDAVVKPKTN